MNQVVQDRICALLNISSISKIEVIQELWSGYGKLMRIYSPELASNAIIAKLINFPEESNHPRGWNSSTSHQRKVKSYEVEFYWYENFQIPNSTFKIPNYIASSSISETKVLLLEDLQTLGFVSKSNQLSFEEIKRCLKWLARFHSNYLFQEPKGLWEEGCYWHLDTRREEWVRMPNNRLKSSARDIAEKLKNAKFQTLVHGDAKQANFCFKEGQVAVVDFQYVGKGCGIRDVVYFLGGSLSDNELTKYHNQLIDYYFDQLKISLDASVYNELEKEWRGIIPYCWADFERFLEGWSPEHHKLNSFSRNMTEKALSILAER